MVTSPPARSDSPCSSRNRIDRGGTLAPPLHTLPLKHSTTHTHAGFIASRCTHITSCAALPLQPTFRALVESLTPPALCCGTDTSIPPSARALPLHCTARMQPLSFQRDARRTALCCEGSPLDVRDTMMRDRIGPHAQAVRWCSRSGCDISLPRGGALRCPATWV